MNQESLRPSASTATNDFSAPLRLLMIERSGWTLPMSQLWAKNPEGIHIPEKYPSEDWQICTGKMNKQEVSRIKGCR
jgi:hypothetical protein